MKQTKYPTDLTEPVFFQIKPCLQCRRRSKWPLIDIVNAIIYICSEGIKLRALPPDFGVPWQTVYWYFRKWNADGSWVCANEQLIMTRRQYEGTTALPTTVVFDGQSVKNSSTATDNIGVDGGKKIKGRKRLLVSDSRGNLLYARVLPANLHDGTSARNWWTKVLKECPMMFDVKTIRGDRHFAGKFKSYIEEHSNIQVVISETLVDRPSQTRMPVHKGRWVIERTIAWITNSRRLARDYERLATCSEAYCIVSSISRLLRNPVSLN